MTSRVHNTTYYDLLGIRSDASVDDIKRAYRKLALKYHPDRNKDPDAAETFKKINDVYQVLSDAELRRLYDQYGKEGLKEHGDYRSPFDPFQAPRQPSGPQRTPDAVVELEVTLEELYLNVSRSVTFERNTLCDACRGVGTQSGRPLAACHICEGQGMRVQMKVLRPGMYQRVPSPCESCEGRGTRLNPKDQCRACRGRQMHKVPQTHTVRLEVGMAHGSRTVIERGAHQMPGMRTGNLVVVLVEKPHPRFQREGTHLIHKHTVTLLGALTGFTLKLEHLDGRVLTLRSDHGDIVKPNDLRQVVGFGMPQVNGSPGNLYVHFAVEFPPKHFFNELKRKVLETVLPHRESTDARVGYADQDASGAGREDDASETHVLEAYVPAPMPKPTNTHPMPNQGIPACRTM